MRKFSIILGLMVFSFSMLTPAFALLRDDFAAVEGPVISTNKQTKEITVRNSQGLPEVFIANDDQFASVKKGDVVLVLHKKNDKAISSLTVTQRQSK
jgi:hypothetical protein